MRANKLGAILVAPSILFLSVILIIPLFFTIYISLYDMKYLQLGNFVGLKNYIKVFTSEDVLSSLSITFVATFVGLFISIVSGTLLALWINSKKGFTAYIIQIIVLIPWVISMVVGALLWKWIFNNLGLLNYILDGIGLQEADLLGNPTTAPIALIFVIAWRTIGFAMVLILAGLKSIPKELIEAGQVDGTNKWQTFWLIKMPLLKTPIMVTSIILMLSNFNNVDVPMVLTGGGPGDATNVITMELYHQGFVYYNFGVASALSFIVLMINILLISLYIRMVKYEI
ncbi:carbohydrate ABC transporter permease [Cohnella cholangitidis]|uniref:Sugar ABC transporter permease n=1 Tax=Cohnella cholangitidis TaxID=2598458 RepID=A0A7G5BYN0_9BACL|nr:sugar ABC transporter permease [Cohnella cholangitidis]QMV42064.1 sugar ABC transporter permease [Cohnella cholangitidis]